MPVSPARVWLCMPLASSATTNLRRDQMHHRLSSILISWSGVFQLKCGCVSARDRGTYNSIAHTHTFHCRKNLFGDFGRRKLRRCRFVDVRSTCSIQSYRAPKPQRCHNFVPQSNYFANSLVALATFVHSNEHKSIKCITLLHVNSHQMSLLQRFSFRHKNE